jgi:surface carbohydrate biosynthesis protein
VKEVDVIFFVEHKDRELESIKLIANKLKEKGKKVLILSIYYHLHYLFKYKAKIFVFPYLLSQYDWPVSLVYRMYKESVAYVNMNWEQLLFPVNLRYKKPKDNFTKKKVYQFCWNESYKDFLVRNGVDEKNIIVGGNVANELLYGKLHKRENLRENFSKKYHLDLNKKWLFLPMNYGWAFSSDSLIKRKIAYGYPENIAWKYREYSKKCLNEFIIFVNELKKRFDYEIVLRPHPSISENDYKKLFVQIIGFVPDILINRDFSIREWIIASDIIGSSWSTSVWDAYNIGKKVFLFTPYKRPEWLNVWWNDQIVNFKSISEFDENKLSQKKNMEYLDIKPSNIYAEFLVSLDTSSKINFPKLTLKEWAKFVRSICYNLKSPKNLIYDKFEIVQCNV